MNKIKVMLVDDHEIVRQGIRQSFSNEDGYKVIADTNSGRSAVELASSNYPDVIIMDVCMPDLNGIEATKAILEENPNIKIVALSIYADQVYVMGMFNAGASGYVLKTESFQDLLKAIQVVLSGKRYLCPDVTDLILGLALNNHNKNSPSAIDSLTKREREVLQLVAEGHTNKSISETLGISKKTVDVHRNSLRKKIGIKTVAELTRFAIAEGVTLPI